MSEEQPIKKKFLRGCPRCSDTGIVMLEKNGIESGFSCLCEKGLESSLRIPNFEHALSKGYAMTENTKLNFIGYDEITNSVKTENGYATQTKIF